MNICLGSKLGISLILFSSLSMTDQFVLRENPVERNASEIYETACAFCHQKGMAGAPKFGDTLSWKGRVNKGLDVLTLSVKKGLNGMPAMGLCMDCSDRELKSAVKYMLDSL